MFLQNVEVIPDQYEHLKIFSLWVKLGKWFCGFFSPCVGRGVHYSHIFIHIGFPNERMGPQVGKRSKSKGDKHQHVLPFWSCFSYFCPKWGDQFFNEFPGGPEIVFLKMLETKSIKKGRQNGAFLKHFLQGPVS